MESGLNYHEEESIPLNNIGKCKMSDSDEAPDINSLDPQPTFWQKINSFARVKPATSRTFNLGESVQLAPNVIRNQKYSLITFFPLVLYEQVSFLYS